MNPEYFATGSIEEIMQTLVHEMVHLWQAHYGDQGRRGYHNKEWGAKMEEIGLMPSDTGKPGGKKTGEQMADYVIEGGLFKTKCDQLLTKNFKITWMDRFPIIRNNEAIPEFIVESFELEGNEGANLLGTLMSNKNKSNRWKYTCLSCKEVNVWGKPNLKIKCGICDCLLDGKE